MLCGMCYVVWYAVCSVVCSMKCGMWYVVWYVLCTVLRCVVCDMLCGMWYVVWYVTTIITKETFLSLLLLVFSTRSRTLFIPYLVLIST